MIRVYPIWARRQDYDKKRHYRKLKFKELKPSNKK